jgi:hypothetical protein
MLNMKDDGVLVTRNAKIKGRSGEAFIRGLPRFSLRAFIVSLEIFEMRGHGAMIMFLPPDPVEDAPFASILITRNQLMREYYGAFVPSVKG